MGGRLELGKGGRRSTHFDPREADWHRVTREVIEIAREELNLDPTTMGFLTDRLTVEFHKTMTHALGGNVAGRPYVMYPLIVRNNIVSRDASFWEGAAEKFRAAATRENKTPRHKWSLLANAYDRCAKNKEHFINEYASIALDPDIGYFYHDRKDSVLAYMAVTVTHEIAHAIDHTEVGGIVLGLPFDGGGHGKRWKAIYRVLRNAYVNNDRYLGAVVAPIRKRKAPRIRLDLFPDTRVAA